MYVHRAMVHVLVSHGTWRYRLRGPQDGWIHEWGLLLQGLINNCRCFILIRLRSNWELWSELRIIILESYILAEGMFVELTWSKTFRLMDLIIPDRRAVLSYKFTHWVISVNTITQQIYVRSCHQIAYFLVVCGDLGHVLFIQDLLCKDLLHYSIAVVHFWYLWHHSFGARVYLRHLTREENTIKVLFRRFRRLRKPFLHHSSLSIVCEVIWPIRFCFVPSLIQSVGL